MVRFLKAEDIPMDLRRPHLERYRRQLRDALAHPALTQEQRDILKIKLSQLGKPKDYAKLAELRNARNAAPQD